MMIRSAILAALFALPGAGAAQAADVRITGGAEAMTVEYLGPAPHENVLGGAVVRVTGGGDNAVHAVERVEHAQPGRDVVMAGGGDEARFLPRGAPPAAQAPRG
ncbi:hypothetical protein GCM10010964_38500 [Caldovatus sediminis]|uniref:Uncharacterized protein n=1 Tax=Caldovatus sediminis TaxID=2041189 RepID=A0A8J2ZEX2_9PROT|nr:hypothetical protein [Caldovatus sediminis]GGG47421.1 hypothetical protein GCM10010964_38500 [Caldovatus sediminis]